MSAAIPAIVVIAIWILWATWDLNKFLEELRSE